MTSKKRKGIVIGPRISYPARNQWGIPVSLYHILWYWLVNWKRGWRVGHNPPSVLCGIQLSGLPASFAEIINAYLPLHPTGQPFHRFHSLPQWLNTYHRHPMKWTFRFCSVAQVLTSHFTVLWFCRWMEFPQLLLEPTAAHRLTNHNTKRFAWA